MNKHVKPNGKYEIKWRDATGRQRSKTFTRERDADRFDAKMKIAQETGTLTQLDGGRETLDKYVESTWAPIHTAARPQNPRPLHRPV